MGHCDLYPASVKYNKTFPEHCSEVEDMPRILVATT